MSTAAANRSRFLNLLPLLLLGLGLILLVLIFASPVQEEVRYQIRQSTAAPRVLTPPSTDFALVIPAIWAAAPVVENVDPYDSRLYQKALTRGVAHARGSGLPGEGGNIFLFAHSSRDLITARQFNSVFYLLHKLEKGDEIRVWYQGVEHIYAVTSLDFVAPSAVSYLTTPTAVETLRLMTCWPPGTTYKRLIVTAHRVL